MGNKTTAKDFALFKTECLEWIGRLHLAEWEVEFEHAYCEGNRAMCSACSALVAILALSTDWEHEKPTPEKIKAAARHEVMELLLIRVMILGKTRFCREEEFLAEGHAIINRLMPLLKD